MRVLHVSQEMPPETGWGGIGTYVGIIAPALVRAGAEVHVLSVVRGQARSDVVTADGVHVHRRPLRRPPGVGQVVRRPETWNRLTLAAANAVEVRRLGVDADVIECPEWMAESLVLGLNPGRPVVVRLHSSADQVLPWLGPVTADGRSAIRLEDAAIRRAHVVTGTRAQTDSVGPRLRLDPAALRSIIYPVIPHDVAPPDEGPPRICFAGRYERRKGLDVLVAALPEVRRRIPDVTLALVGRDVADATWGPSVRRHLQGVADSLGVGDAVEWVERWGHAAVAEEAARSTVVAVPSLWESFGYVAAECLSLGRPVVAADIPALRDVVDDGVSGRFAPCHDAAAWAAALADVLADRAAAAEMGRAGAAVIRERCDPGAVAAQTLDAYELAAARFASGRRAGR